MRQAGERSGRSGQAAGLDDPHEGFHRAKLVHGPDYYFRNCNSLLPFRPFIQAWRREIVSA